jgi:MFS family permease
MLEICAILCTCKELSWPSKNLRHFVHCYLFTVSIYIGAASVGCLLSGITMDLWGRRLAVQIAIFSMCIGFLLIAVSTSYPLMLVGMAECGFGKGVSATGVIVSKKRRNTINTVKNVKIIDNKTRT